MKVCNCHRCFEENLILDETSFMPSSVQMILCPICGNKRCQKASDHRNECTGSNDLNQKGSIYDKNWNGF